MQKSPRARAEEQFAATQKKAKQALNQKEKARQEITERMARQRALRLAKEAAEKGPESASAATHDVEEEAAEGDEPALLPQVHRQQC